MRGDSPLRGGFTGRSPLPETALNACLCLPGERSLHFLTVVGAGNVGVEVVVFGLGQVAAQTSAAQVPRLWTGWPLGHRMFWMWEGAEHYQSASGFPPTPSRPQARGGP